jgi:hypothetical protein
MLSYLGLDETKAIISGKYQRVLETMTYDIMCWRHTEEGGYVDSMSENRLINEDFITWINILTEQKCVPQWKISSVRLGKIKWRIMFIYANVELQVDPLYKWAIGPNPGIVNTRGTAYLFKHAAIQNMCMDVFTHMVGVASGGIFASIPKIWFIPIKVDDSNTVKCKCGGQYTYTKWKRHRESNMHNEWIDLCKELCVSIEPAVSP